MCMEEVGSVINKQDFDKINQGIARRNAGKRQLQIITYIICLICAIGFVGIGVLVYAFGQNCIAFLVLAGLCMIPFILVIRIKEEPYYTFEQYAHARAAQKSYLKQVEAQHIMQYGYGDMQPHDTRYIPDQLRLAIMTRDNYRCRYCGSNAYLELDHIIPLSKGGATSYENLQVLCRSCNQRKGAY